jgi:hypothetical protein
VPAAQHSSDDDDRTRRHLVKYLAILSLWTQIGVELPRISRVLANLARAIDA